MLWTAVTLWALLAPQVVESFVSQSSTFLGRSPRTKHSEALVITDASSFDDTTDGILDVPFETLEEDQPATRKKKKKKRRYDEDNNYSLLDVAMEQDPFWKDKRIPFVAKNGESCIDCKLAMCVELDGYIYGIGVPWDHAVICAVQPPEHEEDTTPTKFVDPDDEENEELINLMASALHKQVSEDLKLKKTPQILTIEGDLDKYVNNWQDELYGPDEEVAKELMKEPDFSSKELFAFFREQLGEEEYEEVMNQSFEDADIPEEALELFNVPGFGTEKDDVEGIKRIHKEAMTTHPYEPFKEMLTDYEKEGAAIKIVGFKFRDGNFYCLAKPLQPHTIVGRKTNEDDIVAFDLLSDEEMEIIYPKLHDKCLADLEKSGLTLPRMDLKP